MSFFKAKQLGFLAGFTLLALGVAQGCSSGDDSQAAPNGGSSGKGNAGSSGKAGSGNSSNGGNDMPGAGGEAGATPTTPGGGDSGAAGASPSGGDSGAGPAPECDGPNGCYSCAPTTDIQFANYCVTGGCPAHFDNSTLSKIAKVGTL